VIVSTIPLFRPVWENQFSKENPAELARSANDSTDGTDQHNGRQRNVLTFPDQHNRAVPRQHARIAIKTNGRILFAELADVVAALAQGNYCVLQRETGSFMVRESISALAEKLRPYGFVQIHRSVLVNSIFVEEIRRRAMSEYVRVKGGREYTVTRTYKKNIQSFAELWVGMDTPLAG
jgi:DNA-binding LytR/AlgR family response regulator